jgi:hypothetical protein
VNGNCFRAFADKGVIARHVSAPIDGSGEFDRDGDALRNILVRPWHQLGEASIISRSLSGGRGEKRAAGGAHLVPSAFVGRSATMGGVPSGGCRVFDRDAWRMEHRGAGYQHCRGVVKASIATVTLGDRAYMSTYNSYPEDAVRRRPITSMLDGARDGAIANVKGKLRSEQKILISNLPGRFIIIDAPNNIVLAMQVFLMKNTLIQGVVAGPPGVESEPDTKRMLGSLKVVKP